jgi:hypothetical protein
MENEKILLLFLIFVIFTVNYEIINDFLIKTFVDCDEGIVERVIDGDTIVVRRIEPKTETQKLEAEIKVRLLGINSPEKGEFGYEEAKFFLENKILDKKIKIYFDGKKADKYGRILGYVFLNNVNINLESVRHGYSNFYFPNGKQKFYSNFINAWLNCMEKNEGICKKSDNQCVEIKSVSIREQKITLENLCPYNVKLDGWSLKDEGRKKIVFSKKIILSKSKIVLTNEDFGKDYVWTKSGDSAFLRDNQNYLVDFYHFSG